MEELDSIITLLEAMIPANPNSPKNIKLAGQLGNDLKKYFNKLEDVLPAEKLAKVYNKYVEQG